MGCAHRLHETESKGGSSKVAVAAAPVIIVGGILVVALLWADENSVPPGAVVSQYEGIGCHYTSAGSMASGSLTVLESSAQDKKLSKGEIKKLKDADIDPEALKGGKSTGGLDLYKDKAGNVLVKPKGGHGPGEPTGVNLNNL